MSMPFKQLSVGRFRWSTCRCMASDIDDIQVPFCSIFQQWLSQESEVQAVAWHLAGELQRMEEKSGAVCRRLLKMAMSKQMQRCKEQPPPKRRKGSLKLDPNLVPGTRHGPQAVTCHGWPFVDFESLWFWCFKPNGRFLTASILHGEDPVAPAGMAMGLALARGAKQMDRQSSQNSHRDGAASL